MCRVKMYYILKVLHQLLMVLFLHNLDEEILYLLLDWRGQLGCLETVGETIQGPKRNLIVLQ